MSTDLHDLLHAAATRLDPTTPDLATMSARIRRRRRVRAGSAAAGVLVLAGALVVAATALPGPHHAAPAIPSPTTAPLPTAVAGAEPGACGWKVGAPGADGQVADDSDATYQLGVQAVRPHDARDPGIQVETRIFGTQAALPETLLSSDPTLVLARDGVVVARAGLDGGGLDDPATPLQKDGTSQLWGLPVGAVTGVRTCGPDARTVPDGTYQLWALQTVDAGSDGRTLLLGGGQDIEIRGGAAPSLCGASVSDLPATEPGVDLSADVTYGDLPEQLYPGIDHDRTWLAASTSFSRTTAPSLAGSYAATIYLADAANRIVADGTDPTLGQVVGIDPIGAGDGGDGTTTPQLATRCDDGEPLAPGSYRAFVVLSVDRAGGTPGIVHLVAESAPVVVPAD